MKLKQCKRNERDSIVLKFCNLAVVAMSVMTGACSDIQKNSTFGVGQDVASQMLDRERRVLNGTGMGSLTLHGNGIEQQGVHITISRAGSPRSVTCFVTITPISDQMSSTEVDCSKSTSPMTENEQRSHLIFEVVVKEHIRATLETTDYDIARVTSEVIPLAQSIAVSNM